MFLQMDHQEYYKGSQTKRKGIGKGEAKKSVFQDLATHQTSGAWEWSFSHYRVFYTLNKKGQKNVGNGL